MSDEGGYNGIRIPLLIDSGLLIAGVIGIGMLWARQDNSAAAIARIEASQDQRAVGQQDILGRLARIEVSNSYIQRTVDDMREDLKAQR